MKNIIVGTAGHIDHGKTSLVQALTGINADRLAEEKRRGITIDLGFAHLQLTPGLRLGFVDVPGHERFVRNMLAGVGGIDLVIFVIAADESIKPQTREHFDICRLLGIRHGIIALTKCDLAPDDLLDLVKLEVEEFVAGSFLENAPMIPVSAVTRTGLDDLGSALQSLATEIGEKDARGPARLPIDRAFSIKGFGTVVTGTLLSGAVAREDELVLLPANRPLRVRGLEAYGKPVARAAAGTRTAVNLADIESSELHRGMVLTEKNRFETTTVIDCSLELLASARALKHRAPVHFHSGTFETAAEVRLFGKSSLAPGSSSFARLRLREPVVLAAGDRFILRQFSPVITIAGGQVIDIRPPVRERSPAKIDSRLSVLSKPDEAAKLALLLEETPSGISLQDVSIRLSLAPARVLELGRQIKALIIDPLGFLLSRDWVQKMRVALARAVQEHHQSAPLTPGIPRADLKARLLPDSPQFVFDALLGGIPELILESDRVRHRTHRIALKSDEEEARRKIESAFDQAGLTVPPVAEVLANSGVDPARGRAILQLLLKESALVRINEEMMMHRSAFEKLKQLLAARKSENFTVSTFKDWTGISRKYAVPLLEFLDRQRLTLRQGDQRRVL